MMQRGDLSPLPVNVIHPQLKPIPSHCNDELLPWFVFMLTKKAIGGITSIHQPEVKHDSGRMATGNERTDAG